jgi:hypothetical protein
MNLAIKVRMLLPGSVAVLMIPGIGCNSTDYDKNAFDFDPERSRTRAVLDAQYAKGAADDGSLSAYHFEGGNLNGLGRDKLDRMLASGRPHAQLVVHIDVPAAAGETHEPLVQAVRDYLTASGVDVSDEMVVLGPSGVRNPSTDALAGVHRLHKDQGAAGSVGSASNDVMASQHAGAGGE